MRYLATLSLLLTSLLSSAQVMKGSVFLGGNITGSHASHVDLTPIYVFDDGDPVLGQQQAGAASTITINPQIGVFISNKSVLGGGLSYQYNKNQVYGDLTSHFLSLDAFHRLFIPILENHIYFVLHSQVTGGFGKRNGFTDSKSTSLFSVTTGPGFAFFPSRNWSFKATFGNLGFTSNKLNPTNQSAPLDAHALYFSAGFNAGVSLYYYFGKGVTP